MKLMLLLVSIHVHYMMVRSSSVVLVPLRPTRREFFLLTGDILGHGEFNKLKQFRHHSKHIYDHAQRVAYLSYCVSKVLCLDYASAARGGLLHDFFLYDWRERKMSDPSRGLHGREHPRIALENAKTWFELNYREEDIILKHMYPKAGDPPKYMESAVVSLCDKIAALYEYSIHLTGQVLLVFKAR